MANARPHTPITTINKPKPRGRALNLEVTPQEQQKTASSTALENLVWEFFITNRRANAYKVEATRAKEKLNDAMVKADRKYIKCIVKDGERSVPVEAEISAEYKDVISVEKLRALLDEKTFMRVISATKKDVQAVAGENIMIAATVEELGKEALHVRELK